MYNSSLFSNIVFIYSAVWKHSRILIITLLPSAALAITSQYFNSFILKYVIDLLASGISVNKFATILFLFFLLLTSFSLLGEWLNLFSYLINKTRYELIIEKNIKIMSLPYEMLEDAKILDYCQKATMATRNHIYGIEGFINTGFTLFNTILSMITGLFIVSRINTYFVLLIFSISFINFCVMNILNRHCKTQLFDPLSPILRKEEYLDNLSTDFAYAKEIRMFRLTEWLIEKYKRLTDKKIITLKKNSQIWNRYAVFSNFMWLIFQILLYSRLLCLIIKKEISLGDFTFYISISATFFQNVSKFFTETAELIKRSREVDDFRYFMNLENVNEEDKIEVPKNKTYNFEFKNVYFKYPNSEKYILEDINFKFGGKEKITLVGLNGTGKSTFIKLLLGLYVPTSGKILLNGKNIRQFKTESYFKLFSTVFQEINIFALPIWQNISLKSKNRTDFSDVEESLEKIGLKEKIQTLDSGLDTEMLKIIEDKGTVFSGGENQKLAIARALYKDSECFVMDEPDSALDPLSEESFYANLKKLLKNKIGIIISHRLSSINISDRIVVFENAKITECGTKKELLEQGGKFSILWRNHIGTHLCKAGFQNSSTI